MIFLFLFLAILGLTLWLHARIARHAGYSGWWCLIALVPLVNIAVIWVFAFADWPALKRQRNVPNIFE